MIDQFNETTDVTIGTEVVVILPPDEARPEKIRRATVREIGAHPQYGIVLLIEVRSTKTPGKTYLHAIQPQQVAAIYEGEHSVEHVKASRRKTEAPVGATAGSFSDYVAKKPLLN